MNDVDERRWIEQQLEDVTDPIADELLRPNYSRDYSGGLFSEGVTGLYLFTPKATGYLGKKHLPLRKIDEVGLEALLKDDRFCVVPIELYDVETEITSLAYLVGLKQEERRLYVQTIRPVRLSGYVAMRDFSAFNHRQGLNSEPHLGPLGGRWNPIPYLSPQEVLFSDLESRELKQLMNSLDGASQGEDYELAEGSAMFPKTLEGELHETISP